MTEYTHHTHTSSMSVCTSVLRCEQTYISVLVGMWGAISVCDYDV